MSERAQALEQVGYFLDAIDEIATIGAAPKGHIGMAVQPPSFHMTPSTAKNIKWNTREIRSKLALLVEAPAEGVSPQPDKTAQTLEVRINMRRPTPTWDELHAYAKALACVKAERDELQALAGAILRSVRDDQHGEQWTIRKFLDDRGVYNDNLSGSRRLVEAACKKVIGGYDAPPVSPAPVSPVEPMPLQREEVIYRSGFQAGQRYEGQELRNLLAIIHRDGGHHTEAVGITQSVQDAHRVWADLIAPTGEPAPCVWREERVEYSNNHARDEIKTSCRLSVDADELRPLTEWPYCPQCGHPLKIDGRTP